MASLFKDLRFAVRTLTRRPGLTAIAVLTLSLGIGASTAIFSAVNSVLLRPLPYDDSTRLVYVGTSSDGGTPFVSSVPDFLDWKERLTTLDLLAAMQPTSLVMVREGDPQRITVARVSPDLFSVLGATPALGPGFSSSDFTTGAEAKVVLSAGIWQRQWGGDRSIIGRTITTVGSRTGEPQPVRVVGVMPEGFRSPAATGLEDAEMWVPLAVDGTAYASSRTSRSLRLVGRLRAGVSLETVQLEAAALSAGMATQYPQAYPDGTRIGVVSLLDRTVGRTAKALMLLLGATGLLLLIACGNVASLLLVRVADRGTEMALRAALGASRRRIVRQLITECLLLALLGGVCGVVIAIVTVDGFRSLGPADFPRLGAITVDVRVLIFALGLTTVTGVLFGLAPAGYGARANVATALKEGSGRVSGGKSSARFRSALIVVETALAMVLLVGAGLLMNSYVRLQLVDPGFNAKDLHLTEVGLDRSYASDEQRAAAFREILERTRAVPGIELASLVPDPPISGYNMWAPDVYTDGGGQNDPVPIGTHLVGPDYFEAMGIRLIKGRSITSSDDAGAPRIVVASEAAAAQLWPGEDPIGKRLRGSANGPWLTVVGLVDDIRQGDLASPPEGELYVPYAQNAWFPWAYVVMRSTAEPEMIASAMRQVLRDVDPDLPFDGVVRMSDRVSESLNRQRFNAVMLVIVSTVGLVLTAAGIYGMLLYSVVQRTHEVGVRLALGAKPSDVLGTVMRQGMTLAASGIVLGFGGALILSRLLTTFVFGVTTTDPPTLLGVAVLLGVVAFVACYGPARRATRTDPMTALRSE